MAGTRKVLVSHLPVKLSKAAALVLRDLEIKPNQQAVLDELRDKSYNVFMGSRLYSTFGACKLLPLHQAPCGKGRPHPSPLKG